MTLHYNGLGRFQEQRPVELGFVGEPNSITSIGMDTWAMFMLDTWGDTCITGPLQFGFIFDLPAYNVQMGLFQINGIGAEDGTFPSPQYGNFQPPVATLPGVQAGDLVVGWINTATSVQPYGYGPGKDYRFISGTPADSWEYQIAPQTTDLQLIRWAGRPTREVKWVQLAGAYHPSIRSTYCSTTHALVFPLYRPLYLNKFQQ